MYAWFFSSKHKYVAIQYVLKLKSINVELTIGTTTAKNCEEIFGDATKSSGDFTIDPDGDGAIEPFTVYCDTIKSKLFF